MTRSFARDRSGNIAILFALLFAALGAAAALAVDAGSLYLDKRRVQAAVDLAAIQAARAPHNAFEIARKVIADAGFVPNNITVEMLKDPDSPTKLGASSGRYVADPSVDPSLRFSSGAVAVNAVRVSFETPGRLYFAGAWSPIPTISASALAASEAQVAFSVGSRLASLGGGVVNGLLNDLLGTTIALKAVDYNGLAQINLDAFRFLDALAFELGITAGTYNDVLSASASHHQILKAIAATASGVDSALAHTIAAAIGNGRQVGLSHLLDLGTFGNLQLNAPSSPLALNLNALDLVGASAVLADGGKQIAVNAGLDLPGVARVVARVAIGEPPEHSGWVSVGAPGARVRTAQVRVLLIAEIPSLLGLVPITVKLPIYLDLAGSEGVVTAATCPTVDRPRGAATISVKPGVASLSIGKVNEAALSNFRQNPLGGKETIVNVLGLVGVTAFGQIEVAQSTPVALAFSSTDIAGGVVKTASTRTVVGSLLSSLLNRTTLSVDLLAIPLLQVDVVLKLIGALLTPLAPALDGILVGLLDTLGVAVGEADVKVYGVTCATPVLVG